MAKPVKAVLHEAKWNLLLIVNEDLSVITYNLRSKQLSAKARTAEDLYKMLQLDEFLQMVPKNKPR